MHHFVAESERSPNHTHVLLITTGSVASIKAPLIVEELLKVSLFHLWQVVQCHLHSAQYKNVKVEVAATKESLAFFDSKVIEQAGSRLWKDEDEWSVR